jgi:hypothetical protein
VNGDRQLVRSVISSKRHSDRDHRNEEWEMRTVVDDGGRSMKDGILGVEFAPVDTHIFRQCLRSQVPMIRQDSGIIERPLMSITFSSGYL